MDCGTPLCLSPLLPGHGTSTSMVTDTFQLAASYAEAIACNHPFVDGNKRTAFMATVSFLELNGRSLQKAKGHEHAEMMEQFGQGKISREEAAAYLREHSA